MNKKEFKDYYWNMSAMKYYETDLTKTKALDMINNKDDNYLAMIKWDGEWNMAIITEDEVLMRGRNKTVSDDYKNNSRILPHITSMLKLSFPPGTVLLGEIAYNDITKTAKNVGSIMRCNVEKALKRQQREPLSFHIFDCLAFNFEDIHKKPFEERIQTVYDNFNKQVDYIYPVKLIKNNFMNFAETIWSKGGEGIIIIKKDEPYRPGSRKSWLSLKLKKKLGEIKVEVIDFLEPNKNYEGKELDNWKYFVIQKNLTFGNGGPSNWVDDEFINYNKENLDIGYKIIPVTKPYWYRWKNGIVVKYGEKIISVASGLTDAIREWLAGPEAAQLLKNKKLYAIITGMEFTSDSIRHPVFLRIETS